MVSTNIRRWFRHLLAPQWWVLRAFDRETLDAIEDATSASERGHRGELRFVVEGALPLADLVGGGSARERALDLFSRLRVWDTQDNSGILIYVQMTDRRVEIVADRGIAAHVPQSEWDDICRAMETAFAAGNFRHGALDAVSAAGRLLQREVPPAESNPDELPDRPLVM